MKFTTQIPIAKSNHLIDYNSQIMSLGSCFAENMSSKLSYYKFISCSNPFGILFHPAAIKKLLEHTVNQQQFTEDDIFYNNERWHCFDAHSEVSNTDKQALLNTLNIASNTALTALQNGTHLIITLGTAWVYRFIENNEIVANCHKVSQKQFSKELLSVTQIKECIETIIKIVREVNSHIKFIFTVSPVRHIKDGFTENQWSKANLIVALHETLNTESYKLNTAYFPSYEIMMDELRDYRFYAPDMIHPNSVAIDYIWERFTENYISEEAYLIMKEVDAIQKGLQHRTFNPESEEHKAFIEKLQQRADKLKEKYFHISF